MLKFGRNYLLTIGTPNNGLPITIQPPFTVEFDITRNTQSSANICSIRIYNLSLNTRNKIRFNIQDQNYGKFQQITFQAGYSETNLPVIFTGNITQAWSVREGQNFITAIECFDGGFAFANGFTSESYPSGSPQATILSNLAGSLPHVTAGAIGSYPGVLGRGNALVGNTTDLLRDLSGGGFFIDNGQAHCLGESEYIDDGAVITVNAETGLLGTPVRETTFLDFDIIFEPMIKPGRIVLLQSSTDPTFNGDRKVIGIKHRGMISDAVCGDAITSVRTNYSKDLIPVTLSSSGALVVS